MYMENSGKRRKSILIFPFLKLLTLRYEGEKMKKDIGKYIFLCCLILTGVGTFLARSVLQKQNQQTIQVKTETGIPNKKTDSVKPSKGPAETTVEKETKHEQVEEKKTFQRMPDQYLDGSLFIGDSRTSTLAIYSGWKTCSFWVKNGISIWEIMDAKIASINGGENLTVRQGLSAKQYSKIYIMLGINELGTGTPRSFYEQYEKVILEMRQLQPGAKIFVQSILHVTDGKDQAGSYINNKEIDKRNSFLAGINRIGGVYYLDLNTVFDDPKTNKLNPAFSTDGVHLKATQIDKWKIFLLNHGIE